MCPGSERKARPSRQPQSVADSELYSGTRGTSGSPLDRDSPCATMGMPRCQKSGDGRPSSHPECPECKALFRGLSQSGFLSLGATDISSGLGDSARRRCSVCGRVLSSISGLSPVVASNDLSNSSPPVMTTGNVSRHCLMSSRGQNNPQLRTPDLN